MSDALPKDAQSIIQDQLKSIATTGGAALSIGALGALLFTIYFYFARSKRQA